MVNKWAALNLFSLLAVSVLCWQIKTDLRTQGERVERLHKETLTTLEQIKAKIAQPATSPDRAKTVESEIAPPSRNPTKDVTGASARAVRRKASKNQCARACETMVDCLAGSEICPGIGTSDSRSASLECAKRCTKDPLLKSLLMDKTDCPTQAIPDIPVSLRNLCLVSR